MSLKSYVKRAFRTIVPTQNRLLGSTYITQCPTGAVGVEAGAQQLVGLIDGVAAAWNGYGNLALLLLAADNIDPPGLWVEGILIEDPLDNAGIPATGTFAVGIGYEATGTPAVNPFEAEVVAYLQGIVAAIAPNIPVGPYAQYIPLNPPAFIPVGNLVSAAMNSNLATTAAAAPKCCVRLVLSRMK